jgi:D-alanine transaminase
MLEVGYYNGAIGPLSEMTVPMNDRAVYFGDGVYELALVRNGKIFGLAEHLERFYNSLMLMEIDFRMDAEELTAELFRVLAHAQQDPGHTEQSLYWQVSRGPGPRKHTYPDPSVKPNLLITVSPKSMTDLRKRMKLITREDTRFMLCNIKTLNLVPNILARQAAENQGCDEVVFYRGEMVTECSASSISILKNGTFRTAPLNNYILPGVTRRLLLERCRELLIPVDETAFTLKEMMDADEVIITSTTRLCLGVDSIDQKEAGGKAPDLLTKLQDACMEYYLKETEG